ncbi:MAG: tetratricopeptide repeat protein [candidate division WOR-3 bacterium]
MAIGNLKKITPLVIFLFAFFWRLLYLFQAKANDPLFFHPQMDPLYHHQMAISILKGGWLAEKGFFRAPLYPYFLALIYKIFGINLLIPRIIQALIGSASCLLIYLIGKKIFSPKVGTIAGLVATLYPLLIYFDGELLLTNLLIFLTLLGFFLFLKEKIFLSGLSFGFAAITRPNILLFLLTLFIIKLKEIKKLLPFFLAVILPIIPVTIHNYIKEKDLILIAWQGGINFYIGNNPESDGMTAIIPGTRGSWWGGLYDAKRIAEEETGRELKPSAIDRFWFKKGLEFILKNPQKSLPLFLRKLYLFFSGYEISNNRDIYLFSQFTYLKYLIQKLPFFQFPFGLLFPLSLIGIYFALREKRKDLSPFYLFLITYPLSFILFFVTARYRMALIPILILFAAYGFWGIIKKDRKPIFFLFLPSYLLFNADLYKVSSPNLGQSYTTIALAKKEAKDSHSAFQYALKALKEDSLWIEAYNLIGVIFTEMGQLAEAEEVLKKSLSINPYLPETYHNLGNLHYAKGEREKAKEYYEIALKLDPHSARTYNNLGNLYLEEGKIREALLLYEKAYYLEPLFDIALFHLGLAHYYLGEKEKAHSLWRKVLEINPENKLAKSALYELK